MFNASGVKNKPIQQSVMRKTTEFKTTLKRQQSLLAQLHLAATSGQTIDRRIARTRVALLEAAQRLLSVKSIDGLSIDEIVHEADVAKGSFYNHFEDKEALAEELFSLIRSHAAHLVTDAIDPTTSHAVQLVTGAFVLLKFTHEHPESASALMRLSPELLSRNAPLNVLAKNIIENGMESGDFTGMPADSATLLVVGVMLVMHQEGLGMKWPLKRILSKMSPLMSGVLKAIGMNEADAEAATNEAAAIVNKLPS